MASCEGEQHPASEVDVVSLTASGPPQQVSDFPVSVIVPKSIHPWQVDAVTLGLQARQSSLLIVTHEAAVADNVGGQYRGSVALHCTSSVAERLADHRGEINVAAHYSNDRLC
jgi:hypothetical protein